MKELRIVTFTYKDNENILHNVKVGDRIHFRAIASKSDMKTMILRKPQKTDIYDDDKSPIIESSISRGTDIVLNSNPSGVPSHIVVPKESHIDYYLTVIEKDKKFVFSDSIVITSINGKPYEPKERLITDIFDKEKQTQFLDGQEEKEEEGKEERGKQQRKKIRENPTEKTIRNVNSVEVKKLQKNPETETKLSNAEVTKHPSRESQYGTTQLYTTNQERIEYLKAKRALKKTEEAKRALKKTEEAENERKKTEEDGNNQIYTKSNSL